jgi:hypothetical protein
MSKNNNVNPGQYKVAGRERQGENLEQTKDKQAFKASPSGKTKGGEPQPPQRKGRASTR